MQLCRRMKYVEWPNGNIHITTNMLQICWQRRPKRYVILKGKLLSCPLHILSFEVKLCLKLSSEYREPRVNILFCIREMPLPKKLTSDTWCRVNVDIPNHIPFSYILNPNWMDKKLRVLQFDVVYERKLLICHLSRIDHLYVYYLCWTCRPSNCTRIILEIIKPIFSLYGLYLL